MYSLRNWSGTRWLAASFFIFWALVFGLRVESLVNRDPRPPFFITSGAEDAIPVLQSFRPGAGADESGLRVGDRLLRLGGHDLTGVGSLTLFVVAAQAGRAGDEVIVDYERSGVSAAVRVRLAAPSLGWLAMPLSLTWALLAALLLLRSSWTRSSRYAFGASAGVSLTVAFLGGSYAEMVLSVVAEAIATCALTVFALLFASVFPESMAPDEGVECPPPRWPWLFLVIGPLEVSRDFGLGLPADIGRISFAICFAAAAAIVWRIFARKSRTAGPVAQREIRIVLTGLLLCVIPSLVGAALVLVSDRFVGVVSVGVAVGGAIPAIWAIAILRFGMFDVDRILGAATTSTIVAVLSLASGLFVQTRLIDGALHALGDASLLVEISLVGLLGAFSVLAYMRIRPYVETVLFPERVALREGVGRLTAELTVCDEPDEIYLTTGEVLHEILEPQSCCIYAVADLGYSAVFSRAGTLPARIPANDPLLVRLAASEQTFEVSRSEIEGASINRDGALQAFPAGVIVPIRRAQKLLAFIVLGEKRSGDIYTANDLKLLDALARVISAEFGRFDHAKLVAIGDNMAQMMNALSDPLEVISGYARMVATGKNQAERDEVIAAMQAQFKRMNRMAGDVLAFARGEKTLLDAEIQVSAYLENLRSQLAPLLEPAGITLLVEEGCGGSVRLDTGRFSRAILDVVRGALDAMPRGGTFAIRAREDDERVALELTADDSGVSEATLGTPFEPFSTAARASGRGLNAVRRIAEEHGGRVDIETQSGRVETLRVTLPR